MTACFKFAMVGQPAREN
jgi:hypothetical protein